MPKIQVVIPMRVIISCVVPITFKSKHSPNIVMLEAVALELIKLMGHSRTVPGSFAAEDIPAALARLEQAIAGAPDRPMEADRDNAIDDDDREPPISVGHRALPLIEMLRTAAKENDYVIWDR
jgi:hypothetical protein